MNFLDSFLTNDRSKPENDELEISVFGAGVGEAILVHLGNQEWVAVDSLMYRPTENSIAIEYLQAIGVDPNTHLRRIIASHWHDDHVQGIAQLTKAASGATVVIPSCLVKEEFLKIVEVQKSHDGIGVLKKMTSGVREFGEVIDLIEARKRAGQQNVLSFAIANRDLMQVTGQGFTSSMRALSPSDEDFTRAIRAFASFQIKERSPKLRVPRIQPNHTAIVLWVKFNDFTILLGSDLEEHADVNRGWKAVCRLNPSPVGRAHVVKIPHHGSKGAHSEEVWENIIEDSPLSILTPFNRQKLPRNEDIDRIINLSSDAYSAAKRGGTKVQTRAAAVEKTIRESGIKVRSLEGKEGLVRFRLKGTQRKIQLFGAATTLQALKASQ